MANNILENIVGAQLGSVEFVQDYIQFHFDGPALSAFTWPTITADNRQYDLKSPGYRDALCSCIGKKVSAAVLEDGIAIVIKFEDDIQIVISLKVEDRCIEEAAKYDDPLRKFYEIW